MRALSARRLASAAISATLLIGIGAPAAVAVDHEPRHERASTAVKDPIPGAEALLEQVKTLGDLLAVLQPVTDVLDTVLNAKDGISPAQAAQFLKKVQDAIAAATVAQAPVPVPQAPLTPAAPETTPATSLPTTPPAVPAPSTARRYRSRCRPSRCPRTTTATPRRPPPTPAATRSPPSRRPSETCSRRRPPHLPTTRRSSRPPRPW